MSESAEPFRRVSFDVPGGRMAGIAFGAATPNPDIVFLHATGFNARTYRALLQPLGDSFHVLAIDFRGHGRTELPAKLFGYDSWRPHRDDVIALIERHFTAPVTLAGHSLGGTVGLLVAGKRPDLTAGLALIDPVILPPAAYAYFQMPLGPLLSRWTMPIARVAGKRRPRFADRVEAVAAYKGRGVFAAFTDEMLEDYAVDGFVEDGGGVRLVCTPAYERATFAAQRNDVWGALRKVTDPLVLLRAERESTIPIAAMHRFAAIKPDARIATVEGAGHMLPMERPDRVRSAIESATLMGKAGRRYHDVLE
ncbi:MAG: alpha/beta hydrolase [Hyphomonadaceae bacterium]|nr:alpha/beta hydrolase [Hyphomonadaceae bacterium]